MSVRSGRTAKRIAARLWNAAGGPSRMERGSAAVLVYHRVLPDEADSGLAPALSVPAGLFAMHMETLGNHFEILDLEELTTLAMDGGLDPSKRYAAVTFDDGWRDNHEHAWPILKRCSVPATIFLATSIVGTDRTFWWEDAGRTAAAWPTLPPGRQTALEVELARLGLGPGPLGLVERLKALPGDRVPGIARHLAGLAGLPAAGPSAMTWDMAREMAAGGIAFAPHTRAHAILTALGDETLEAELTEPRETIWKELGRCAPIFCYPNGDHDARIVEAVRRTGHTAAVTCRFGRFGNSPDPYRLPRISVTSGSGRSPEEFLFHLSGLARRLKTLAGLGGRL